MINDYRNGGFSIAMDYQEGIYDNIFSNPREDRHLKSHYIEWWILHIHLWTLERCHMIYTNQIVPSPKRHNFHHYQLQNN
jgi:hypothetical protein